MPLRGLPPSSRSSAWARTVFPAPVSPVRTLRPEPNRSSARSISRRFSTRSSSSTRQGLPTDPDGSRLRSSFVTGSAREPAEALAQAVIEARARQLRQHRGRARELDVDVLARVELDDRPPVDVDLD